MYNAEYQFDNHHRDSRGSRPSARLAGMLLALAAAIAVLLIMPTAPTAAQAVEVTLVKNTGQTLTSSGATIAASSPIRGAGFTTGSNPLGYTLTSIGIRFEAVPGAGLTATLNESTTDSSNNIVPGTAVCTLANPASFTAGTVNEFAVPQACGTVAANTTFFLVLERDTSATWQADLRVTDSDNEDSGAADGWSIENSTRSRFFSGGTLHDWSIFTTAFLIEVKGTIVTATNNAATGLTISGTAALGSALTADTSSISDDDGLGSPSYSYQWVRGSTDITGATA